MSEQAPKNHESQKEHENLVDSAHEHKLRKSHELAAEKASHEQQKNIEKLESIRRSIEEKAETSEATEHKLETPEEKQHHFVGASVKEHNLQRSLTSIRRSLSGPEKQFSKVIHNPAVDQISEIGGKTIARPSGLLFAGIFALIANISVIVICRYFGYEYNYFIGIAAFVIGFVVGLIVELLLKARPRKNHQR